MRNYDLVVFGDELGGLVTAATAARAGLRTLRIISAERHATYLLRQHRCALDFLLLPLSGGALAETVFRSFDVDWAVHHGRTLRGHAQLVLHDARIDLRPDRIINEVTRELASDVASSWRRCAKVVSSLRGWWHDWPFLPRLRWWQTRGAWRRYQSVLATLPSQHGGPAALAAEHLVCAVGGQDTEAWSRSAAWQTYLQEMHIDVAADLDAVFADKYAAAGGETRVARVEHLVTRWGAVTELRLAGGDIVRSQRYCAAASPKALCAWLRPADARRMQAAQRAAILVGHRHLLQVVLDVRGLPEGIAPLVLTSLGQHAATLAIGQPNSAGHVLLTIATTISDGTSLAQHRQHLLRELETVMPFYSSHLIAVHSPNEAQAYQSDSKSRDLPSEVAMRAIYRCGNNTPFAHSTQTPLRRLSIVGPSVMPGFGLEGELLTSWSAGQAIARRFGARAPTLPSRGRRAP